VLKSRGMSHSNQAREFLITDKGIDLVDAYFGPTGVLTGAARIGQVARDRAAALRIELELNSRKNALQRKRAAIERQIATLQAEGDTEEEEFRRFDEQARNRELARTIERTEMARARHAESNGTATPHGRSRIGSRP
jgi:circadian clock protein KaiC